MTDLMYASRESILRIVISIFTASSWDKFMIRLRSAAKCVSASTFAHAIASTFARFSRAQSSAMLARSNSMNARLMAVQ